MRIRPDAAGTLPDGIPADLTGYAITLDLGESTLAGVDLRALVRTLYARGAARVVVVEPDHPRFAGSRAA